MTTGVAFTLIRDYHYHDEDDGWWITLWEKTITIYTDIEDREIPQNWMFLPCT